MKLAILLTVTVKVQVVGGNFNMEERAAMYASTLRYYADRIGKKYPIVFWRIRTMTCPGSRKNLMTSWILNGFSYDLKRNCLLMHKKVKASTNI